MTRYRADEGLPRGRPEAGVAVVWSLAWICVCLTVGWVGLGLSLAVAGQHRADADADLVSLAAASEVQRGRAGCETAATVAAANDVQLTSCRVRGEDVVVSVRLRIDLPFGLHPWASARSRAGPE